ncbi:type VI secretion system baseplate subunit TssE [Pseudomonas oryzihabitans]|uniref:type VI secretion system baseplate subunit TssE n=1 Tax=Pseudomonas oryzihabitans TaxID=47885 RepID=UPI002895FAF8|nr:type VI secretion system baseplate subunit TssE [Pseudomonas oryzihabitans]MDT3719734.1 type VI secretion system baseplate subunit TssE [Pseudomonas oryzihabitans]
MSHGSLFERLAGTRSAHTQGSPFDALSASVAAHLAKMLSTRAGSVPIQADYGLPDLNDLRLSLHDSLQRARLAIEHFVASYEPRLSRVKVLPLPREGTTLAFALEGQLELDGQRRPIRFTASLDGSGQVKVSQG